MNWYEQAMISMVVQWLQSHKSAADRINRVRPELEVLRSVLDEVLTEVTAPPAQIPAAAPAPVTPEA